MNLEICAENTIKYLLSRGTVNIPPNWQRNQDLFDSVTSAIVRATVHYNGKIPFKYYSAHCAKNAIIDHFRRQKTKEKHQVDLECDVSVIDVADEIGFSFEDYEYFHHLLAKVARSNLERFIFKRYFGGESQRELGRRYGIDRLRVLRIIKRLRREILVEIEKDENNQT